MRLTKHDMRAARAMRPIVDFTEPAMHPTRRGHGQTRLLLASVASAVRSLLPQ